MTELKGDMVATMTDNLLTIAEVESLVSIKKSKIYELTKTKRFPCPIKIGSAARWSQNEVSAWIEAQKEARFLR